MAGQVHLLIHSDSESPEAVVSWASMLNGVATSGIKQGTLQDAAADIAEQVLVAYVPAIDVLLTRANLPGGRRAQLLTALPYALEDNLIEDVDRLHCALGRKIAEHSYQAAVVRKDKMQEWMDYFTQAGLRPQYLLPDIFLLPIHEDEWTIHCTGEYTRLRSSDGSGFVCSRESLPTFIGQTLHSKELAEPARIRLMGCAELTPEETTILADGIEVFVDENNIGSNVAELLSRADRPGAPYNLLQGPYAPQTRLRKHLQPWYSAAAMAAVLLILILTSNIMEYISLSRQNQAIQDQISTLYQQLFPGSKNVRNPYQRMQSEMRRLQGTGSENSFSEMLVTIAPVARSINKLDVRQLRYQQGKMEILVVLPSLQDLEQFKIKLAENTHWNIELRSADASGNQVQGRLLISKKS